MWGIMSNMSATPPLPPGFYRRELNTVTWTVPNKYQGLSTLGSGTYSTVASAHDMGRAGHPKVALKKMARPFQDNLFASRCYREIRLLRHFKHSNIISLLEVFSPDTSLETFTDVYLVMGLMESTLLNVLRNQALSDNHVKYLLYQVLRGLKYIHSAGVIHRDLKPDNIGVNANCQLKILDFGMARATGKDLTGYVACRWYRAPEIILSWCNYDCGVDVWALGCILAEMLTTKPLFKGLNYVDQLAKIMSVVGTPTEDFIKTVASEAARDYLRKIKPIPRKNFKVLFQGANPLAIDLLEKMLELDPARRISVHAALSHPYLAAHHKPSDEPTAPLFDQSFEAETNTVQAWKSRVWTQVTSFLPGPLPKK